MRLHETAQGKNSTTASRCRKKKINKRTINGQARCWKDTMKIQEIQKSETVTNHTHAIKQAAQNRIDVSAAGKCGAGVHTSGHARNKILTNLHSIHSACVQDNQGL